MGGGSLFFRSPLPVSFILLLGGLLAPESARPPAAVAAVAAFTLLAAGLFSLLATRGRAEPEAYLLPVAAALIPAAFLPLGLFLRGAPDLARPGDAVSRRLEREPGFAGTAVEV